MTENKKKCFPPSAASDYLPIGCSRGSSRLVFKAVAVHLLLVSRGQPMATFPCFVPEVEYPIADIQNALLL